MRIECTSWGIIVSRHMQVAAVGRALTSNDVHHFIPLVEILSIRQGRHIREMKPMLGDYIPVAITSIWESLNTIRDCNGNHIVAGIILNESGRYPAQVLPHEMQRLHSMCDDAGVHQSIFDDDGFDYGQRVTPRDGPFACHVGRYESKNKRGDQTALFSCFGREQRVVFKSGELLAA